MRTSEPKPGERVADVRFDDDTMSVELADGRTINMRDRSIPYCRSAGG